MTRKLQQMLTIAGALWLLLFALVGSAGQAAGRGRLPVRAGLPGLARPDPGDGRRLRGERAASSQPGRYGAADGRMACSSGRRPPTTRPSPMATAPGVLAPLGLQQRLNTEQFDWERELRRLHRAS